jgi:hypothetical protein
MDKIKKFGLWIVAGIIVVAAAVIYLLFVHPVASQVSARRDDIQRRRDSLQTWARRGAQIPNPTMIKLVRSNSERVASTLDQCELYLAHQPRWCETIRFFTEGAFGPETEVPLDHPLDWLALYRQYNDDLQQQLFNAGMSYKVEALDWGSSAPTPESIAVAMEIYWFQKDLIDFLTGQVEKDFAAYLEFKAKDRADTFPAKPFDLVVNRSPARLDEFLRSTSREKLVAVLGAIVVNREQQDLATIFNTLLPDEKKPDGTIVYGFPWERPASEREHGSVLGFTMDEAQEKFLTEMLPPGKPDLTNRQRFLNYVMELRSVRYRADVIGLLESHHFDSLAAGLRRGTEAELNNILSDIADVNGTWNTTRIAEAISAIVSINNVNDFTLVRNNHAPNIAQLLALTISAPGEARGTPTAAARELGVPMRRGMPGAPRGRMAAAAEGAGVAAATSDNGVYRRYTFAMQVKLKFDRIPVFVRQLINNSWRYDVRILDVVPTVETPGATGGGTAPRVTMMPRAGGPPARGMFARGLREEESGVMPRFPAAGATTRRARPAEAPPIEVGNYVTVHLIGEGYQFSPLLAKYRNQLENRATAAALAPTSAPAPAPTSAPARIPAGRSAPLTGAR